MDYEKIPSDVGTIIEQLSSKVHDAWWNEKKSQGFHAPLSCPKRILANEYTKFKCVCEKCHTDMYPYEELPENIKDYDRVTVRMVLQSLDDLGIKLKRD